MSSWAFTCWLSLAFCLVLLALAPAVRSEIRFSHHDFSSASWAGEICIPCHTPHGAEKSVDSAPLWNHALTSATFTVYASATLDAVPGQPSGVTQLCLSCHDGTVALDSFAGNSGTRYIGSQGLTGTVLTKHHPVSFVYDTALATKDGELLDPSSATSGLGSTIADDLLFDDRLECASCHDVHIDRNTEGCTGCHGVHGGSIYKQTLSLRKSNDSSALCLTCHVK